MPALAGSLMRPGRFELPRSKRTTRPSTLRATCSIHPNAIDRSTGSARLDDLDLVDANGCCHGVVTTAAIRPAPIRWRNGSRAEPTTAHEPSATAGPVDAAPRLGRGRPAAPRKLRVVHGWRG